MLRLTLERYERTCPSQPTPPLEEQKEYLFNVHSGSDNLDVVERELRALGHDVAVDDDHRTPVVVQTITVAALLVSVQINATTLQTDQHLNHTQFGDILTNLVACVIRLTRVSSFLSSWWLPDEFEMISTPARP